MSSREFAFTMSKLKELLPSTGRYYVRDSKAPGLQLQVTPKGVKVYYYRKSIQGRQVRIRIARFEEINLTKAREAARSLSGQAVDGKDPHGERQRKKRETTLGGLFDHWMIHAKDYLKPKTWQEHERYFRDHLSPWENRRLTAITKVEVQKLHASIGQKRGKITANRCLSFLHALYEKAADDLEYKGVNPSHKVKRFKEQSRDRYLQNGEVPRFFRALLDEPAELMRDFFVVVLFTACRKSNVKAMRWAEINWEEETWRIPETKTGKAVTVPLVKPLVGLLNRRLQKSNGSPYVFPGKGRSGHVEEVKSAWDRITTRAGITGLTIHDLRRTFSTWQLNTGAPWHIIQKTLGHAIKGETSRYAQITPDVVRPYMEQTAIALLQAGKVGLLEDQTDHRE